MSLFQDDGGVMSWKAKLMGLEEFGYGGMAMIIKKGSPSHELPANDVLKGCRRGERGWWRRRLVDDTLDMHRGSRGCLRRMGSRWASPSSILEPGGESIDQRHCRILGAAAGGEVQSGDGGAFNGAVQRWASSEKKAAAWRLAATLKVSSSSLLLRSSDDVFGSRDTLP